MTAIATQATGLRHVRKTITFDGSAGNGLAGSEIQPFTLTGVVWIEKFVIRCTTNLGFSAGGCTLDVGVAGGADWSLAGWDLTTLTAEEFVGGSNGYNVGGGQLSNDVCAAAPVMKPAVANITSGVVVVDCFYRPVTDDGELVGDDADTELVAAIQTQQMTESYAADGAAPTIAQALMLIQQMLTEMSIAGTTATVKKLDGSTTAATFTLNSDSTPSSITRAS